MDTTPYALNRDYLWDGTVYEASETRKPVPTALAERDQQLDEEEPEDQSSSPLDVSEGLPEAIPEVSRTLLEEAGIDTFEKLKEATGDLEEIDGIGPARAEDIAQAVDQVSRYHESEGE